MNKNLFNSIENTLTGKQIDLVENVEGLSQHAIQTAFAATSGIPTVTELITESGLNVTHTINELGNAISNYFFGNTLIAANEQIDETHWCHYEYADHGVVGCRSIVTLINGEPGSVTTELTPNAQIVKGNFSAQTDALGRTTNVKITDLEVKSEYTKDSTAKFRQGSEYQANDQAGHGIAERFGGPTSQENLFPQDAKVNQSDFKTIENKIARLKNEGHSVDYEVKANYTDSGKRPSSFDVKITVDGEVYNESKVYNTSEELSALSKLTTTAQESVNKYTSSTEHIAGKELGSRAAAITCTVSTIENASSFIKGDISAIDMAVNISKDTAKAGGIGYATGFISNAVAKGMAASSHEMLQSLSGTTIPATVISFGVSSYDTIIDFALGEINGTELAYDLGENAMGIGGSMAGSMAGSMLAGATIGSIIPGAGTLIGGGIGLGASVVGGMVGYSISTSAYQSAVAMGSEAADIFAEKAQSMATEAYKAAKAEIPEIAGQVKDSLLKFAEKAKITIAL